jgi:hypothetical protein
MRQVEVSRTMVFDAPRRARAFFAAMVRDNLGIGRPDQAELIFTGRRTPRGRPRTKPETFKTKIVTRGAQVTVNAFKHSRIKHYLKDGRALRIETVVNCANDLGAQRRLHNLPKLQRKARQVNHRMLYAQRTGPGLCHHRPPSSSGSNSPT